MFNGPSGLSSYDSGSGKFNDVTSINFASVFDYVDAATFAKKGDLSIAGMVQDCAECHVGGGAMEYVPNSDINKRTPLREITTSPVNGISTIDSEKYTTFNYFIDTYDVDGDYDKAEVLYNDWTKTGVQEVDCLLCHLEGYSWDTRLDMIRLAKHDASRAVASGLATDNAYAKEDWHDAADYGTTIGAYNQDYVQDIGGNTVLTQAFVDKIMGTPPSDNCASCHMGTGFGLEEEGNRQVDWKKRGDHWVADDAVWDVHSSKLGCMSCHQRVPDAPVGESGLASSGDLGQCDPSKGNAPFSSVWNAKDVAGTYDCYYCHVDDGSGVKGWKNAPDPTLKHTNAGLTDKKCQSKDSINGDADASHIDIMDCSACHVSKLRHYSGGGLVDATGEDHDGRLADHENFYVERDTYDHLALSWFNGKLLKASSLVTMFWRDKNDIDFDGNNDGRGGGMDAYLMNHVRNINEANGWTNITEDKLGRVEADDVVARATAFNTALQEELGVSDKTVKSMISTMGVLFKVNHNVSPKQESWGANGCCDCHAPADSGLGGGFFNGSYDVINHDMLEVDLGDTRTPFTKVNGRTQKTDFHPNIKNKKGNRTVAVEISASGHIRADVTRDEFIYESTFLKPTTAWSESIASSAAISFPTAAAQAANAKGWYVMIDVSSDNGVTVTRHTLQNPSPTGVVIDVSSLLDAWDGSERANGALAAGTYGFTVVEGDDANGVVGGLYFEATAGNQIRVNPASGHAAELQLGGAMYEADPITSALDGETQYFGRADYVAYLEAIGVPTDAEITSPANGADINQGDTVDLIADTGGDAPGTEYRWVVQDPTQTEYDGANASHTFNNEGLWTVNLYVTAPVGDQDCSVKSTSVQGNVVGVPSDIVTDWTQAGSMAGNLTLSGLPVGWAKIVINWDDKTKTRINSYSEG